MRHGVDRLDPALRNDGYRHMKQLIYRSQPFGFDRSLLVNILVQARRNNRRDGITGALVCREDLYLQLIEGPADAIDRLYAKIGADDRHCDLRLLLAETVDQRIFPEWDMLDDEMPTLTWTTEEIAAGAVEAATPDALHAMFEQIAVNARAAAA